MATGSGNRELLLGAIWTLDPESAAAGVVGSGLL
ncbi:hypothetical protein [Sporisorium scitamineum]|uniref:Uncharacterized protein n=1 Tax=Sporisorium scitamineum TaxID=49012 RepID=A0A0F7S4L8_9BASI|nr:hypothetical protein [Sporisorium scitamineum]